MKYSRQKGLLPSLLFGIGCFLHVFFIGGSLFYIIPSTINTFRAEPLGIALSSTVAMVIAMIGFVWSIPLVIGSFFVSAFPDIGVTRDGLDCRVYRTIHTRIPWREITEIIQLRRGYVALTLERPGWNVLNGLYSNKLYGDIVRSKHPVLLIAPGLDGRDSLLRAISTNLARGTKL